MSTPVIHILVIALIIQQSYPYYLSPNTFLFPNAEAFCINVCDSHLASVHSADDHNDIVDLVRDHPIDIKTVSSGCWIGLTDDITDLQFYWTDGTDFNWGTNINGGQYPWADGEPNPSTEQYQVQIYTESIGQPNKYYEWDDESYDQPHPFICNDCKWNVLNKYIFYNNIDNVLAKNFNDAQATCNSLFGTSLASIHNDAEQQYLKLNVFYYH